MERGGDKKRNRGRVGVAGRRAQEREEGREAARRKAQSSPTNREVLTASPPARKRARKTNGTADPSGGYSQPQALGGQRGREDRGTNRQ